jgi:hypothetical protein
MLRVGFQVVPAQEDGAHAAVPVFHLVAKREAVHRLQEHFGNQQIEMLALQQVERFLAGGGRNDLIARGSRQDGARDFEFLRPVNNENLHVTIIYPEGSGLV